MNVDAKMETTQEDDHVTSLSFTVMRKTASVDVPAVLGRRAALRQAEQAEVTSSGADVPRAQARQRMLCAAENCLRSMATQGRR